MRIAIIHPTFATRGGAENVIIWLASELSSRGHYVCIFTANFPAQLYKYKRESFDIKEIGELRSCSKLSGFRRAGKILRDELRGFDIINPHRFPAHIWVYMTKKYSSGFPKVIWYNHGPAGPLRAKMLNDYPSQSVKRRKHIKQLLCGLLILGILMGVWSINIYLAIAIVLTLFIANFWHLKRKAKPINLFGNILFPIVILVSIWVLSKWQFLLVILACLLLDFLATKIKRKIIISLDRKAVNSMDIVLACCRYAADFIRNFYHASVQVCYSGIYVDEAAIGYNLNKDNNILTVSRLDEQKNIESIIKAFKLILNESLIPKGLQLKIIGTGPDEAHLRRFTQKLSLTPQVEFMGFIPAEELHNYYACAKMLVYVPINEAFALVPMEAMSCGTPVIVSNFGGLTESCVDGITGYQVDPLNPGEIAQAIKKIICDEELCKRMGEAGYKHIRGNFTIQKFANRLEKYFTCTQNS